MLMNELLVQRTLRLHSTIKAPTASGREPALEMTLTMLSERSSLSGVQIEHVGDPND